MSERSITECRIRLIVSPGLPRSGTTYTFQSLADSNGEFFNLPKKKETRFFMQDRGCDEFFSQFRETNENKYYLDYTPTYLVRECGAIDRISRFPADEKKIILHLRNPIDQLFSHYLHDIKNNVAKRTSGNVKYPLFGKASLRKYLVLRREAIDKLVNAVGRENVVVINFHKELRDPSWLVSKLGSFLGLDLNAFRLEPFKTGGWLPYYEYGGRSGTEIAVDDYFLRVPPHGLVLVNGHRSEFWPDIDAEVAHSLISGATTWTREINKQQFDTLYKYVEKDWLGLLDTLGEKCEDYEVSGPICANPAPVTERLSDTLQVSSEDLEARLARFGGAVL